MDNEGVISQLPVTAGGSLGAKNLHFPRLRARLLLRRGRSEVLIKYTGNVWLQKYFMNLFAIYTNYKQ